MIKKKKSQKYYKLSKKIIAETIYDDKIKILKNAKIVYKNNLNYLHVKFMTLKTDLKGTLSFYV